MVPGVRRGVRQGGEDAGAGVIGAGGNPTVVAMFAWPTNPRALLVIASKGLLAVPNPASSSSLA